MGRHLPSSEELISGTSSHVVKQLAYSDHGSMPYHRATLTWSITEYEVQSGVRWVASECSVWIKWGRETAEAAVNTPTQPLCIFRSVVYRIAVHLAEKPVDGHVARRRPPATSTSGMARKAPKWSKERNHNSHLDTGLVFKIKMLLDFHFVSPLDPLFSAPPRSSVEWSGVVSFNRDTCAYIPSCIRALD